jgi:hypothetical protein
MKLCQFAASQWVSPFRQTFYWFTAAIATFAATTVVVWFGGFGGVALALIAAIALAAAWAGIFVTGLVTAWVRRSKPKAALLAALTPIAGLLTAVALALPAIWTVAWICDWTYFLSHHSRYQKITNLAEQGKFDATAGDYNQFDGTNFIIDPGPPRRIAFPLPGGFLDNWSAIVYDRHGEVMQADGFNPTTGQFVAPERITKLFYGDLLFCRHMQGSFYTCSFT